MELRELRTLLAVVDCGSFSNAADQLGYTQSAVSQQISALESEFGTRLLQRRPVLPTPSGIVLIEHARELLRRSDSAEADLRRLSNQPSDTLAIAMTASAERLLPISRTLAAVTERPAALRVQITSAHDVAALVGAGACDIGLLDGVTAPSDPLHLTRLPGIDTVTVQERPIGILLPRNHPLAARTALSLEAVSAALWVEAPALACPTSAVADVARTELRSHVYYDGQNPDVVHDAVRQGWGLAFHPLGLAVPKGTTVVRLEPPRLNHRVELWRRQYLSGIAQRLLTKLI